VPGVSAPETVAARRRSGWLERIAPAGPIIFAIWGLITFFSSGDSGDTAEELIAYAADDETALHSLAFLALATPLLLGPFVASLTGKMARLENQMARALTLLGGTGFVVFFVTAMLSWSAPLLDTGDLSTAAAESYLAYDDFGWIILGTAGVCAGLLIIGTSLAAMQLGWAPAWVSWVGVALGVASFATVAFLGMFAWLAWFIAAGALLLWRSDRLPA
jgi:hypothetical protein